jgi:hypothetical protein
LLITVAAKAFLQTLLGAPRRNKEAVGTYTTLIVGSVAILAYILRVTSRLPGWGSQWGLDDWALTLAMVILRFRILRGPILTNRRSSLFH